MAGLQRIESKLDAVLANQEAEKVTDMTTRDDLLAELGRTNGYLNQAADAVANIAEDQQTLVTALEQAQAEIQRLGGNQIDAEVIETARTNADSLGTLAAALENTASAYPPPAPTDGGTAPADTGSGDGAVPNPDEAPGQTPPTDDSGAGGGEVAPV